MAISVLVNRSIQTECDVSNIYIPRYKLALARIPRNVRDDHLMRCATFHCDKCGWEVRDIFHHKEEVPKHKKCGHCGGKAKPVIGRAPGVPALKGWPLYCESAGVMPDQIPEARKADAMTGVPTDFTRDGRRIFNDRAHMRDWLKANGWHNRDGGYGDG